MAWALGELRYRPAVPAIRNALSPEFPNRIRAMAARALGRIGDPEAIPDLVAMLEEPGASLHIKSSVIRGPHLPRTPVTMRPASSPVIDKLGTRNERFELVAASGEWMHTPIEWVLRANTRITLTQAIAIHAEEQPTIWTRARGPLLESVLAHDLDTVRQAFRTEIDFRPDSDRDLFKLSPPSSTQTPKWTPSCALAAAIVLFAPLRKSG